MLFDIIKRIVKDTMFHIIRKYKVIFSVIGFIILSSIIVFFAKNFSLSERFSDEINHFIAGHFILHSKKPYLDFQLNHQPLLYYFSSFVELLTSPSNTFFYITYQRLAVALYSISWHAIFLLVFGPIALIFSFIFELHKFQFSGYKLLGETLATYPLILLFGLFLQKFLFKKEFSNLTLVLISISAFLVTFTLLPLWIVVTPLLTFFIWQYRRDKEKLLYLLTPGLFLTIILFTFVPLKDWFYDTFLYSIQYFLPLTVESRSSRIEILLMPFYVFVPPYSLYKLIVLGFFTIVTTTGFVLFKQKKTLALITVIIFLYISNPRVGDYDFGSFHLFPWFGILTVSSMIFFQYVFSQKKHFLHIFKLQCIILIILFVSSFFQPNLFAKKDLLNEYYNNYSESETYGNAIAILKDTDDKLVVAPYDSLIYKIATIEPKTHLLEYYDWVYLIPEYKYDVYEVFQKDPPEFFVDVGLSTKFSAEEQMLKILENKYTQLNHVGKPSKLFILNSKLKEINDTQWAEAESKLFTKP